MSNSIETVLRLRIQLAAEVAKGNIGEERAIRFYARIIRNNPGIEKVDVHNDDRWQLQVIYDDNHSRYSHTRYTVNMFLNEITQKPVPYYDDRELPSGIYTIDNVEVIRARI